MKTPTLDLSERVPFRVVIEIKGKKQEFQIPTELTVAETERILEREVLLSAVMVKEVEEAEKKDAISEFVDAAVGYLEVLFNRYHPEMTADLLKETLTHREVIRITQFFKAKRYTEALGLNGDDGKKKSQNRHASN
jgi:hypothetical protein